MRDDLALVAVGCPPVHARYSSSAELLTSRTQPSDPSVLLVDDDALVRRIYATGLSNRGLSCVVAGDGAVALDLAARLRPAVAVVDLVLPDMDGAEVVRRWRRDQPDLPVIVLSNAFADVQQAAARRQALRG